MVPPGSEEKRKTRRGAGRRLRLAAAVVAVLLAVLAFHSWIQPLPGFGQGNAVGQNAGAPPPDAPKAVPVVVAKARTGAIAREISVVGTLRSNRSVVIRPEIAGRIAELLFEDGETVGADEPLLRLDSSVLEAELEQARSGLELRRANVNRAGELLARGTGTVLARDEAEAALRADDAAVKLAESRLAKTIIFSPFSGTVGLKRAETGDYVAPGQDIVNLEDIATLKVDFRVPEIFLASIVEGNTVAVSTAAYPGQSFLAEIVAIDPAVEEAGRSLLVRASLPNGELRLRPGQFVRVAVPVEERPDAVLVPETAVLLQNGRSLVYRMVDGKAVLTPVETGLRRDSEVEIVSGVTAGELVVTLGHEKLRDGVPIAVAPAASES
jgi:membrane fusion protein (multidrug efflux system)